MDSGMLVEPARLAYQVPRTEEAAWLHARLGRATSGANAASAAARSMRRRAKAAAKAIGGTLEHVLHAPENANVIFSPLELSMAYDALVTGEPAACVTAVAALARRFPDTERVILMTEAAVSGAAFRGRRQALKRIGQNAKEQLEARSGRGRPLPMRLARRGVGMLFSGGVLWRGWDFVSTHWSQIAAHLPHYLR